MTGMRDMVLVSIGFGKNEILRVKYAQIGMIRDKGMERKVNELDGFSSLE